MYRSLTQLVQKLHKFKTKNMKATINITCDTCHKTHTVNRTSEIPSNIVSLYCNWRPDCMDSATEDYEERYNTNDGDNNKIDPVPDNQLCFPFVLNEILESNIKELAIK